MWYFVPPEVYIYPMNVKPENLLEAFKDILPSADELAEADDMLAIITLVQGETEDGEPFYAYLAIPPSEYVPFKLAEASGPYHLMDYGDIVEFEIGTKEPSEEVKARMKEEHGANHNFEEDLLTDLAGYMEEEQNAEKKQALLDKYTKSKHRPN